MSRAARLEALLDAFQGCQVAVLGDLALDRYVVGFPARISREAPVLVLEQRETFARAGSAANPAANLAALGCSVAALGLVGQDADGDLLVAELERAGVDAGALVRPVGLSTTTKTRVLAEDGAGRRQQVLRLDRLGPREPDATTLEALGAGVDAVARRARTLVLSDYKGGVICPATIAAARAAAQRHGVALVVDTQGDPRRFQGFALIKSNQPDAEAALGRRFSDEAEVAQGCRQLLDELGAGAVVITRGADGLSALEAGGEYLHLPAENPAEVVDVTGAGDTVIAVLAAGTAAGAALRDAAELANLAAGLVVRRLGVVAVSAAELRHALRQRPDDSG